MFVKKILYALALVPVVLAQAETFDIATFTAPMGWKRMSAPGYIAFEDRRVLNGKQELCQIFLFTSKDRRATPEQNFQVEWDEKIANQAGVTTRPRPQTDKSGEGWLTSTGFTDVMQQGVPMRYVLVSTVGYGKSASVVVAMSGTSHSDAVDKFFRGLDYHAGAATTQQQPQQPTDPHASATLANYVYSVPEQWTRNETRDAIVLQSPTYGNGEFCRVAMLPMQAATGSLADDALNIFRNLFKADPLTSTPAPSPKLYRGISPQGWEYFMIRKSVGGNYGDYQKLIQAIVLVVKLGNQLAPVVGTGKDSLISNCFGESIRDYWPNFFYSLRFRNAPSSPGAQAALKQKLVGKWTMATGGVGLQNIFHADGRYLGGAASRTETPAGNRQILVTTTGWFGDGSYTINGNTLTMNRDDGKRFVKLFRVEELSKDSGRTWKESMCQIDPGASGEVCYHKD